MPVNYHIPLCCSNKVSNWHHYFSITLITTSAVCIWIECGIWVIAVFARILLTETTLHHFALSINILTNSLNHLPQILVFPYVNGKANNTIYR